MKTRLLMVGRTERGFVAEGLDHYLGRIRHWSPVDEVVVAKSDRTTPELQRAEEEKNLLRAIPAGVRLVVLDETGRSLDSRAFARKMGDWRDQGAREVCFVVGGAYGLTDAVRNKADLLLSLSPMTFPHQLVRVLLAEQLYRAWAILKGTGYHH
ncbi:MAG: 23S rRNA (pseudouridine(1915)-N(3))-methyltransferase RlmH [Bacteroidetes bacterium]|nr:23S rRNA (pseudouridine(1915)-N(3))-methyltransferase RlmH [Bacteroidota bacterium]MBX7129321.1 23S rRNA (pseudouridine(1915)-N(3))-methyltransferase RlmH [Flavobacteriales bacterium]MCC6654181.1 23S rRNA (pseudouridine(1915)-N(3))-methyltransferase RlmH [Flavobacteriales bacterium]HMU12562.1 23S rRNA (pseudouridine(1915)-N(3))-methyltransferase RlmH [Flavobacteriales bacterium]HMW98171.1 23S rRNA (pseudouridine(1915)-N(3))-methyltransferase RlmH [Flavobacteriales bacterium]